MSSVITRMWKRFSWVAPSGDIELDQRRAFLARLLTLALALCGPIGLGLLPLAVNPEAPTATQTFTGAAGLTLVMVVCYFLNRSNSGFWSSYLFVGASMCSTLWAGMQEPAVLAMMSIEILLAMALLPLRSAVALSLVALGGHALLLLGPVTGKELAFPAVLNLTFLLMATAVQLHYRAWERKRLAQVQESQQWFQTTLSSIGDAVLAVDPQRRLTFLNPVAAQLTGWSTDDALGECVDRVFHVVNETTGEPVANPVDEALTKRRSVGLANRTVLVSKAGVRRPIADSGAPIVGPAGELWGAVLIFRDMTHEYEVAAQLQHSHRLEALGQLAGGVAHDFNNLLTAIGGGLELAIADFADGRNAMEDLREVLTACEQASGLTRQLLAFSRRQVMQARPVLLHEAIERNRRLLARLLREDVVVESDIVPECWILVDPVQFDQVLMNLALNASDAMPHGGTLRLEAARVVVSAEAPVANLKPGEYGRLRVSDTGNGIATADRARIFEPFFTTKEKDRGTGLGLATVYGIAQQSGGAVTVDSTLGKGTRFDVFFPIAEAPSKARQLSDSGSRPSYQKSQRRVLVVEDDDLVRALVARVLTEAGHRVVEADSGAAAMSHIESSDSLDLLLTDIVMPELKGTDVAAAFRARYPDTPVLFMSGYADEGVAARGLPGPQQTFIAKPFTPQGLGAAVRRALEGETS